MTSERPHRILWITQRHPPLTGGMAVSSARQVEGLRQRGLALDVTAFTEPDIGPAPRQIPRDNGADYHFSRKASPAAISQQVWWLAAELHRQRPFTRVVGFGAGRAGHLSVTLAAWLGCPSLVQVRGNDFEKDWFDPQRGAWVREAMSRATTVASVAPDLVRRIQALYPDRDVRYLPNGVDVTTWEPLAEDRALRAALRRDPALADRTVIGLFGELKAKKGLPFWLAALREAGLQDRVGLLLVGSRIEETTLRLLDDPTLSPPSLRLPFSDRDRMPGLYAACDFVALPSFSEGLPNVLLEAMACGIPPIVSDAGAMPDVVEPGRTGFAFPAGDRKA
ncbi:MAG: glycosyltransferase, partial [Proteobacteria bacterium]|nr:glycosyltransferase [Pseudomonadota bacterium]